MPTAKWLWRRQQLIPSPGTPARTFDRAAARLHVWLAPTASAILIANRAASVAAADLSIGIT